ncbi:hypothetical protein BCR33DRAFT_705851 [Rhizoclosmatium globosum]|uniref:Uncharacterized protein n=1 Tax=Rhizoclosmatium globosum TaxID=329046 RepID=A0A1Y2AT22_9FUNG|nr:hypothetical protein BCR33DRAFT_705851 [Rhizoclosmatium globosum]|eukprot:ORY25095.1 hypothetical protein BCR33DRAFT_705851 [Rhizoclosmatium globosum]
MSKNTVAAFDSIAVKEAFDSITVKEAFEQLTSFVLFDKTNRNVFTAPETGKILQPANVLTLEIQGIDGIPDFLFSHQIYDDESALGITMPVDELLEIESNTIILIGVSGCGKTRTCFDYARHRWCLLFDCTKDIDVFSMIGLLNSHQPLIKTEYSQKEFEHLSEKLIMSLIGARMLVLRSLLEQNAEFRQFEWLCIQRSRRTQKLFDQIFSSLSSYSFRIVGKIFDSLKREFDGRVIFDESQHLLTVLEWEYRSSKPDQRGISNNQLDSPRSFFSFAAGFVMNYSLKSIWCGTHMRIRNMELMHSAAGGKPTNVHVFTRFTYLTPKMIFNLCSRWIQPLIFNQNQAVFDEASMFLHGRPRFFMSFLRKLIDNDNIQQSLALYRAEMTTEYGSSFEDTSPFYFWKKRFPDIILPISGSSDRKKLVAEVLLQICLSSLFGNGSTVSFPFHEDLDLVSTSLVMVERQLETWGACMAEPIVLSAGLNFFATKSPDALMTYFARQVFSPLVPPNPSAQERGHIMELIIALRFIQGWWQEPELKAFLPKWVNDMNISKPVGILDCRNEKNANMFLQQLRRASFPYVLLPAVNAGPDLRYSVFSCCNKTTSTANSNSSMYVSAEDVHKNIATMEPSNWYKPQPLLQSQCSEETQSWRFVHLRFELLDTAPSLKPQFQSGAAGNDYVICVNLECDFALKFFGAKFVSAYKEFVARVIRNQ